MTKEEKYRVFAVAIVAGKSNKEAAILAGYKAETASQSGSRLAKDPEIQRLIAQMKGEPISGSLKVEPTPAPLNSLPTTNVPNEYVIIMKQMIGMVEIEKTVIFRGNIVEFEGKQYNQLDPKDRLALSMLGIIRLSKEQQDSAKALLPFTHGKVGDQGKKESELERARNAGQSSRFKALDAPPQPIQMSLIN
ncbi:terminase small subunit [Simonsiella muelleri]|uniref:terminase small subunit n=1 Tax=Simonsiella muelleri TaxID=72 RepID=UPI0023F48591|nr:terminase small subunit [Simonsiella muelleri]